MEFKNMQDQIQNLFTDYAAALSKGDISKITSFYAPTFVIEKDGQEITTSNDTMFKASLWLWDFLTKWNDEISVEPEDISTLDKSDDTYTVKVMWIIRDAEGKEQKRQEVIYKLSNKDGLKITASTI